MAQTPKIRPARCITLPNAPSVSFHQRLGFKKVAHFERVGCKQKTTGSYCLETDNSLMIWMWSLS